MAGPARGKENEQESSGSRSEKKIHCMRRPQVPLFMDHYPLIGPRRLCLKFLAYNRAAVSYISKDIDRGGIIIDVSSSPSQGEATRGDRA